MQTQTCEKKCLPSQKQGLTTKNLFDLRVCLFFSLFVSMKAGLVIFFFTSEAQKYIVKKCN